MELAAEPRDFTPLVPFTKTVSTVTCSPNDLTALHSIRFHVRKTVSYTQNQLQVIVVAIKAIAAVSSQWSFRTVP